MAGGGNTTADGGSSHEARKATLWMLGAVAGYMPLPLIVWAGVRDMSPYLFVALWYAARPALHALLRQKMRGRNQGGGRRLAIVEDLESSKPGYLLLETALKVEYLLFAIAITLVEPVVATVVFEFWPVIFALLTLTKYWREKMLDGASKEAGSTATMLMLLVVGGIGVSFAVLSDTGTAGWSLDALLGLVLAAAAAFCTASTVMTAQLMGGDQRGDTAADQTAVSASGSAAAQALMSPVLAVVGTIGLLVGRSGGWSNSGMLFALAAGATNVAGNWCFNRANHLSRRTHGQAAAQINTLFYLTPVGSLLLLVLLADTTIERTDLFIVGTAAVLVVNMVLHLDPEGAQQRAGRSGGHGYQALVLALWAAGAAVLFRDDWLPDGWRVWSVVEYWGMIGVCATVFTLILSFRQSRLAERRRDMDSLMLRLHRDIVFLGTSGDLVRADAEEAAKLLRKVDTACKPRDLSDAYFLLRKLLIDRMEPPRSDRERAKRLSDLLADVEVLVNLRQQGRNFTELAVLNLFASLTVVLAVAARPAGDMEPFAAWVHDTTSLVIAAAFTFLGFDLLDKRREADSPTLRQVSSLAIKHYEQPPGWRLELVAYRDRTVERIVSSLLGAVLLVGFVTMLGIKWL